MYIWVALRSTAPKGGGQRGQEGARGTFFAKIGWCIIYTDTYWSAYRPYVSAIEERWGTLSSSNSAVRPGG